MKSWQEDLFKHSLMKKQKVRLIQRHLRFSGKAVFDLGCSNGTVSFQLAQKGGTWIHADLDRQNLLTGRRILNKNLFQLMEDNIPLKDHHFDCVLMLDYLEHIQSETLVLQEIIRILKSGGLLVLSTPISGGFFILNWFKRRLGLHPEMYGHKREGYSLAELNKLVTGCGFHILLSTTYAKFFTELFEILLNALFMRINNRKNRPLRTGSISPASENEIKKSPVLFTLYTKLIYPVVSMITRLDDLLQFKTGYATLVIARKNGLHKKDKNKRR